MQELIKRVTRPMIAQAKAEAERLYMERMTGFTEELGALQEFIVTGADALVTLVIEKVSEGWSQSQVSTQCFTPPNLPQQFAVYLIKPEAVRAEELKEVYKAAEAKLHAAVEAENEVIVQRTFEQRVAAERRKRAEAAKAAEEAEEAALMAEVRAALMEGK